ncbi:unnamed protein product [Musa hybrid cultivar]
MYNLFVFVFWFKVPEMQDVTVLHFYDNVEQVNFVILLVSEGAHKLSYKCSSWSFGEAEGADVFSVQGLLV